MSDIQPEQYEGINPPPEIIAPEPAPQETVSDENGEQAAAQPEGSDASESEADDHEARYDDAGVQLQDGAQ